MGEGEREEEGLRVDRGVGLREWDREGDGLRVCVAYWGQGISQWIIAGNIGQPKTYSI